MMNDVVDCPAPQHLRSYVHITASSKLQFVLKTDQKAIFGLRKTFSLVLQQTI